jgi:hypothetical protein
MAFGGTTTTAVAATNGSAQLFNNSSYAEYLLLRDWSVTAEAIEAIRLTLTQTNLGLTTVPVTSYLPTETPPPGLITAGTTTTGIGNGYNIVVAADVLTGWSHNYPFCIIPPGWYFSAQIVALNHALTFNVMWEAIKPEQLDEGEWLQANAALLPQNG